MMSAKGHCISLPHKMRVATHLPLLPSEVAIVVLRKKGTNQCVKQYTAKRNTVEQALRGLCFGFPEGGCAHADKICDKLYTGPDHESMPLKGRYFQHFPNQYYNNVSIQLDRLESLPTNRSELPGIKLIELPNINPEQDKGPAEGQFESDLHEADESITTSGIVCPLDPNDADKELKLVLGKLLGNEGAAEQALHAGEVAGATLNHIHEKPVSELKTPGFFSMAYPTVFINASCDFTAPRLVKIPFKEYIEHIYYCVDNRVSTHPFLKFFLMNLQLRMQALQQGRYVVAQQLNDAHLTIPELRENLRNEDESVPRKIISMATNFVNTDPYWREQKRKLDALTFFHRKEYGDLPAYFDTNSCAEYHWTPLHELLIKYVAKTGNLTEDYLRQKFQNDSTFKRQLILSNLHIVSSYFDARTINYFATVNRELFAYDDCWWRYEFAKSRGEIHSHSVILSIKHAQKIEAAMQHSTETENSDNIECDSADKLHKWLQTTHSDEERVFSPNFVSMHPGGGQESVTESGNREWVPNRDKWAAPEGTQPPPDCNPLAKNLDQVTSQEGGVSELHTSLVNRVALHRCNGYCLRSKKKKDGQNQNKYCRFHFGHLNPETKKTTGKEIHPFKAIVTEGEHPRYEGPRDHPRLIMHVKSRLLSWSANCDTQPIVDQDLLALQKYLASYACKGASTTEDLINVYRYLIESIDEQSTVRNLAQRLLLKTVGMVDVPGAAADYINCGGKLLHCTRTFQNVGISGYRQLNLGAKDGALTKDTPLDKFLSEKRRQDNPNISLWDWAKQCKCACKCDHVPVFTGLPVKPVWPVSEDYAKAMLMIFSNGTWHTTEDLKGSHETFAAALAEYLMSENCPTALTETLEQAKKKFDKKRRKNVAHSVIQNEASQSTSSQLSENSSQGSISYDLHLGRALMRDIAQQHISDITDPHIQKPLPTGGPNFDWHNYALECFGSVWPNNPETWIKSIADNAEKHDIESIDQCILPQINLLLANKLQRVVIGLNIQRFLQIAKGVLPEKTAPLCLLVQGTAGVGKTFVITALTRIARRIFKKNGATMNLAPTGAASVLLPNGRTVHSMTPPPMKMKKNKDFSTVQLSDYPLNANSLRKLRKYTGMHEDNTLKLMCLNLDERGMWSHRLLAWCSQRLKEATGDLENCFGGIPVINFFGDLGQLGPVLAKELYEKPHLNDSPDNISGYAIYRSFENVIVLSETMRQGPNELLLFYVQRLLRIRNGTIMQKDWQDINARYEGTLSQTEQEAFASGRVLTLMETWKEVHDENHIKLANLNVPVAVIPSKGRGKHHSLTDKQVGQIVQRSLIAVNSTVLLTKNQLGLTGVGLNNGAIGKVVAVLYAPSTSPPEFPLAVVVDFPGYKGPAWVPNNPNWIPIPVNEGRCDSQCCTRTGLPLMPGYAITIAKSQGMSIGANKPATHMRVKLQQSIDMEKCNLGTTYTAFSRCEKEENWCLVEPVTQDRLMYINEHPHMRARQEEEKRLIQLSQTTLEKYDISLHQYVSLLLEVDNFCNDQIHDGICNKLPSETCSCASCQLQH